VKPLAGTEPSLVAGLNVQCTVSTSSAGSNVPFAFVSWNTVIVADVNAMSVMKFLLQPSAWTASLGVNTRHSGRRAWSCSHIDSFNLSRPQFCLSRARIPDLALDCLSIGRIDNRHGIDDPLAEAVRRDRDEDG